MKKYIGKRIINFLIVLVGVSILSFLLIAWSGKDPAEIIAHRGVSNPTPEQIEMIRVEMGLDQPLPVRYIQWLSGMFTGELGTSLTTHQPIVKDLHKYLATTTSLVGMAILWIIVLTVPISLLCARKRNRLFDQVTRGITICGICMPTFWLGFLLLLFFAIHLKWFSVLPSPGWRGFLLPSFALAVPSSCSLIRIMRSSLLAELSSDYVRFAKARGLSANRILVCHILRNALPPVVTIFFQQFGFLIAGGAVIESVFSIKGIGTDNLVSEISFAIKEGESLILLGQSGSGKTMTCSAVLNLLDPKKFKVSGSVFFGETDLLNSSEKQRRGIYGNQIVYIPQNPMTALDPSMRIGRQMDETLRLHSDKSRQQRYNYILRLLHDVGLDDPDRVYRAYPHMLSGGMLQRVIIAMAMMLDAKFVLADEPTTALDVIHRNGIIDLFSQMKANGVGILMVTHDFATALQLGGNILVMKEGKIIESGEVQSVFDHTTEPYTRSLIEAYSLSYAFTKGAES